MKSCENCAHRLVCSPYGKVSEIILRNWVCWCGYESSKATLYRVAEAMGSACDEYLANPISRPADRDEPRAKDDRQDKS